MALPRAVPVQTYGQPKVEERPIAGAHREAPGPESFGAGLGGTLEGIGLQGYAEAKQAADQRALLDADNDLVDYIRKAEYDPDTQTGWSTVKGKAADQLPDAVIQGYRDYVGQVSQTLTPRQRTAFQARAQARGENMAANVNRYAEDQRQVWDTQETEAGISNAQDLAARDPGDLRSVKQNRDVMLAIIQDHARRQGFGPEETQYAQQKALTQFHTGVIDSYLAQEQDRAAQIYYEETKDQISADAQTKIERALEEGTLRGESQRRSDAIMAAAPTEADALDQVKQIDDPKLRDEVQSRVTQAWSLKKQAERDDAEQRMVSAGNLIDGNPAKGVRAIPPATWTTFTPSEKASLEAYAKRNAPGEEGVKTDLPTYYKLMAQASTDPQGFANQNLLLYLGRLGKTEFKELADLQNSVRNKKPIDGKLTGFRTADQVVTNTLHGAGIGLTNEAADRAKVATFYGLVNEQTKALEQLTGKSATPDQVQKIADDLITRAVQTPNHSLSSWFGFGAATVPKRLLDLTIDDVPATDRQQITQALQKAGRLVSDDTVLQVYRQRQLEAR